MGFGDGHAECTFFGPQREHFLRGSSGMLRSDLTSRVTGMLGTGAVAAKATALSMPSAPGAAEPAAARERQQEPDRLFHLAGISSQRRDARRAHHRLRIHPRVTLDLTGRIPTASQVTAFVADTTPAKRANLVETLLGSSQWVDRWTMFFGDLYKNASTWPSTSVSVTTYGRDAFNTYIRNALVNGTPYNQVASALIGSQGTNNFTQGELNWMISGRVWVVAFPSRTPGTRRPRMSPTLPGDFTSELSAVPQRPRPLDTLSLWGASTTGSRPGSFLVPGAHQSAGSQGPTTGQNLCMSTTARIARIIR